MKDFPVSELRVVVVSFWESNYYMQHVMHKDMVEEFVEATKELHFEPRKKNASLAKTIHMGPLRFANYWWCNPGLTAGYPGGPEVYSMNGALALDRVWIHPDALKEEEKAMADEEAASERFDYR